MFSCAARIATIQWFNLKAIILKLCSFICLYADVRLMRYLNLSLAASVADCRDCMYTACNAHCQYGNICINGDIWNRTCMSTCTVFAEASEESAESAKMADGTIAYSLQSFDQSMYRINYLNIDLDYQGYTPRSKMERNQQY